MIQLTERVVLLTGAAGGIGRATAEALATSGARVLVHDLSIDASKRVAEDVGVGAHPLAGDLSDPLTAQQLWDEAAQVYGHIDVLVNNAGAYPPARLDGPLDAWLNVWNFSLDLHLVSPAVLCRAAVQNSSADRGIVIINLASRSAFQGEDGNHWHYAAAKAGVVAMTRSIARQYGRQGVTAFAVAPGYVDTDLNKTFRHTVGIQGAADETGLGEVAQPRDVANVIAFLASGLARHATGTTIDVNSASYIR